jgi:hypothetical protein
MTTAKRKTKRTGKNIFKSILILAFLLVSFSFVSPKKEIVGREPILTPGGKGTFNKQAIMTKAASIAVPFVKNVGQFNGKVKYAADLFGGRFFLTEHELVYSLFKGEGKKVTRPDRLRQQGEPEGKVPGKGFAFREYFLDKKGSSIDLKSSGEHQAETVVSYFKGNDAGKWRSNVPSYQSVSLGEVYPGIEVKLKAGGKNVEKIFYVSPQGNAADIKIGVAGVDGFKIDKDGKLIFKNSLGELAMRAPVAWQEIAGQRHEVKIHYRLPGKYLYGFYVTGDYNENYPLVIDPDLDTLMASTFLGGSDYEISKSLTLDGSGNVYIIGNTLSLDFPTTIGAYSLGPYGTFDIFVSKLDGDLSTLRASTYLGGSDSDGGNSLILDILRLDVLGNVYITGYTYSWDFPITQGAFDWTFNGGRYCDKAFVCKLDSNLTKLLASTFLGGSLINDGHSLALDSAGNVCVTGYTSSMDFPVTSGAYDRTVGGGDAFISKLDSHLTTLLASTFLGGSGIEQGNSLALDSAGNVYLVGGTDSTDFPTTPGVFDRTMNNNDVFISKLDNNLTTLLASTFLGGSNFDNSNSLALDGSGNVYLTGGATSADFPTTPGAYDRTIIGTDVFISKLDNHLTMLLASTFLGGSGTEWGNSLALDSAGNVYLTGGTESTDFPTTPGAYDRTNNGSEAFISKLDNNLTTLLASTFLGGSLISYNSSLALNSLGNVYLTGGTPSADFPTTLGAYDRIHAGGYGDVFISKLNGRSVSIAVTWPNSGESWVAKSVHDISWGWTGAIANVRIEVSADNGLNWSDVISSLANSGSYPWTIPNTPSNQCLVRISDAADTAIGDTSDGVFSIFISLDLLAERREVRSLGIKRQYGWLQFLTDPSTAQISQYRIMRRKGSEYFVLFQVVIPSEMPNHQFQMQDKYLEKNTPYTYRVEVFDYNGHLIGRSAERTI